MKSPVNFLKRTLPSKRAPQRRSVQLEVESLEGRWVPATVGAIKYGMLDFDGEYISSTHMEEGGWKNIGGKSFASFHSLFNNSRPWLEMNGDGVVNSTDAELAIDHIIAKVRADFKPFKLSVFEMDQDDAQVYLRNGSLGDVSVIITGSTSEAHTAGSSWLGVAPTVDVGNDNDEIVFVFAGSSVDSFAGDRYKWFNQIARTISHEMGHAFGLDHEVSEFGSLTDPLSHSIMATENRDWDRDFVFQDRYFTTEDGTLQNAYRELLKENVLGRSESTFLSVLKPGVLTVSGNSSANSIQVSQLTDTFWKVVVDGQTTYVVPYSLNVHSLNPFDTPINRIEIFGEAGNDSLYVAPTFSLPVISDGGTGDDYVYGGAANDVLLGGDGVDRIYGRGGNDVLSGGNGDDWLLGDAGNDWLLGDAGNDLLVGGYGNDYLFGSSGYDRLYGNSGDDYLDGGIDGIADYLYGGSGADRFKAEWYWSFSGWLLKKKNRDNPVDFNTAEGDAIV